MEYFSSGAPFGRPRCEQAVTLAPAATNHFSVGKGSADAEIVVDHGFAFGITTNGHVEITTHQHVLTRNVRKVF
jgi:hypothetical protein